MYKVIGADGKEYGPITADQLRGWIAENRANAQTRVLPEGSAEWKPLSEIPEFAPALFGAPAAAAASAPGPISIAPSQAPKTNPMALTGMISGILSVTCGLCCYGLPFNVLGIIFSLVGLSQIKNDPAPQKGRGMAIAGLVLSIISIAFALLILIVFGFSTNRNEILQKLQKLQQQ
jgi:hypothetical protein